MRHKGYTSIGHFQKNDLPVLKRLLKKYHIAMKNASTASAPWANIYVKDEQVMYAKEAIHQEFS